MSKTEYGDIFTAIHREHDKKKMGWAGSSDQATKRVQEYLPTLFKKYDIRSMIDLPCGRFNWIKKVILSSGIDYTGMDVVPDIIKKLQKTESSKSIRFIQHDIVKNALDVEADLILCRDLLVHFVTDDALIAIENMRASGSKYLLATTFTIAPENSNLLPGQFGWRPLNLTKAPFNFPEPIEIFDEGCTEPGGTSKSLGLWRI